MKYDVTEKELPKRYVASVRQTLPAYDKEQFLWNILMEETKYLYMRPSDPCYPLAVFHDKEYKESDVDVEIQMSVKGTYSNTEHVIFKTEEPILIASSTYKGSYHQLTDVNEAVANWVLENNYEFDGKSFCIYHVSPHDTDNPEKYITEVCYPVKKK